MFHEMSPVSITKSFLTFLYGACNEKCCFLFVFVFLNRALYQVAQKKSGARQQSSIAPVLFFLTSVTSCRVIFERTVADFMNTADSACLHPSGLRKKYCIWFQVLLCF